MPRTAGRINDFVKDGLGQAQSRLDALEKEATKVLEDVLERSKASRKEVTDLMARLQRGEMFGAAKDTERDLVKGAEKLGGEVAKRLQAIQKSALEFVGIASRDQVAEVISELEKLAKRLDRLAKSGRALSKKKSHNKGLDA